MAREAVDQPVKHAFSARIVAGVLTIQQSELLDPHWFAYAEVKKLNNAGKLRAAWVRESITVVENSAAI